MQGNQPVLRHVITQSKSNSHGLRQPFEAVAVPLGIFLAAIAIKKLPAFEAAEQYLPVFDLRVILPDDGFTFIDHQSAPAIVTSADPDPPIIITAQVMGFQRQRGEKPHLLLLAHEIGPGPFGLQVVPGRTQAALEIAPGYPDLLDSGKIVDLGAIGLGGKVYTGKNGNSQKTEKKYGQQQFQEGKTGIRVWSPRYFLGYSY